MKIDSVRILAGHDGNQRLMPLYCYAAKKKSKTLETAKLTTNTLAAMEIKKCQKNRSDHLIFFAFSLIVSPFTNIPFPLYGSGFLHILIFAANCITTSFSTPSSNMRVG